MKKNQTTILTPSNDMMSAAVKAALAKVSAEKSASSAKRVVESIKTGISKSSVGAAASASARIGGGAANAQSMPFTEQTKDDAGLLNEKQQQEAALARQLPADFPIENWEKLPAKAQLFQMRYSGLSEQDQWALLNASAPLKVLVAANVSTSTGTRSGNGSGKQQVPFSGQDAETQRAEQRASRQTMNAVSQMNQTLARIGVDTSNLSGEQEALHKAAKIAIANEVLKGTLTQEKKEQIIYSNSQKIAQWTTSQAEGTSAAAQNASSGTKSDTSMVNPSWKQREAETDKAIQRLDEMLESIRVDTFNYSNEQREIVLDTEQRLKDGIMTGTLTQGAIEEIIRNTCKRIATETTPPPGVTYVTLIDTKPEVGKAVSKQEQIMLKRDAAANEAIQYLDEMLESIHVDTSHYSSEQKTIVLDAERKIIGGIINGTLTQGAIEEIIRNTCKRIASETTPPPGVTYVTIMDPSDQPRIQSAEEINKMNSWLIDDEIDVTKFTNEQKISFTNAQQKIRNGATKGLLTDEYVDHVYSTLINELSSRELTYEYTDARGRKVEVTTTTKDLIDPEDDSTGAMLARYALNLYGLGYENKTVLNPDDPIFKQVDKVIDCSGLVNYSAFQISPALAKKVGNGARYQIANTKDGEIWRKTAEDTVPEIEDLETGDLLYWADENNKIVHTAIYLRDGVMVESGNGGVKIAEIRFTTIDNDGSKHNLVQVNRLD